MGNGNASIVKRKVWDYARVITGDVKKNIVKGMRIEKEHLPPEYREMTKEETIEALILALQAAKERLTPFEMVMIVRRYVDTATVKRDISLLKTGKY